MNKKIIVIIICIILVLAAGGVYLYIKNQSPSFTDINQPTSGNLPAVVSPQADSGPVSTSSNEVLPTSSISDYLGTASDVFDKLPQGSTLAIGTASGTVTVNNFYAANPPVDSDEDLIIKDTQNYVLTYDPSDSSFWIGVSGIPFEAWQPIAEQDFLTTLGISKGDACKLKVKEGVIYSPSNPDDAKSFSLSFCSDPSSTM